MEGEGEALSYVNRMYSKPTRLDTHGKPSAWEHAFSQSFIAGLQTCPEQARAQWAGEIPRDYTDSTALGESMHEGIAYALDEKLQGLHPSVSDMVDVAYHHLDSLTWKYTKYSRKQMYKALPKMLTAFVCDILPDVEPMFVEHPFKELLYAGKHRTVYVCGTMDCLDVHGEPWDWKSASTFHEVWEHQRWAVQPTVYTYAADSYIKNEAIKTGYPEYHEGMEPSLFHYGVILLDGKTQVYDVIRDESHVAWLREQCSQIAWLIEHDVKPWVLNDGGWWCSEKWCGKWSSCKGAHMLPEWTKAPK